MWSDRCHYWCEPECLTAVIASIVVYGCYASLNSELHEKPNDDDHYRNEYLFHLNLFLAEIGRPPFLRSLVIFIMSRQQLKAQSRSL